MKVTATNSFFKSLKRIGSFKSKYYAVRAWFKYHFTKNNFNIIKTVLKGYPWDYGYLYELEKAKIKEMADYIEKRKMFVGWEQVVRDMRICINLIDIFTEKRDLFHYDGKVKYVPYKENNSAEELYEIDTSDLKYYIKVYVNTKNAKRFLREEQIDFCTNKHPHELYIAKAKALYHKIRLERDGSWWD